jgi:hypothetical protein
MPATALLLMWMFLLASAPAVGDDASAPARPMPILKAELTGPSGAAPLKLDQANAIEPTAHFRVELSVSLPDVRLQLLDEQDAAVASTGTTEVTGTTTLTLIPTDALRTGTVYRLRLDGAAQREAHDAAGARYAPVEIQLKTSGEKPPVPAKKKAKRRRR